MLGMDLRIAQKALAKVLVLGLLLTSLCYSQSTPGTLSQRSQAASEASAAQPATAADPGDTTVFSHSESSRYWLSGQVNIIFQWHPAFRARYSGPSSLTNWESTTRTGRWELRFSNAWRASGLRSCSPSRTTSSGAMPPAIICAMSPTVSRPRASMPDSRNSARTAPRKSHSPETMKTTGILGAEYSILHKVIRAARGMRFSMTILLELREIHPVGGESGGMRLACER